MIRWLMNCNGFWKKESWLNWCSILAIAWSAWGNLRKTSVRPASV
jgi:hypothetical protein